MALWIGCAVVELEIGPGPAGLIGAVVGCMGDVFGIFAVVDSAEEQLAKGALWWDVSGISSTTSASKPASFLRASVEHWGECPPVPAI